MHLFGSMGTIMFTIGFIAVIWLGAHKLYCIFNGVPARLVADTPYFYIALAAMIMGTQLFLTGFLGELVSRSATDRNQYQIDDVIE
jgi:hypothetical protein